MQQLATPVTLQPGSTYVVSVNANSFFVSTRSGLATQIVSGPLRSVADGQNGVFGNSAGTFPTQSFSSSNYFVDVIASPTAASAPTVTTTSPVSGGNGVSTGVAVTATFSRSMDSSTINGSTVTLSGPAGSVAGTVSYNSGTNVVTLTPSSPLAFGTVYTARIDGSLRAADGIGLGSPYSWSFTTIAAVAPQVTRTVPANGAGNVNGGVVVRADFSKPLNAATVTTTSFKLVGPSGTVAATVAYDSTLQEASLTPTAALAPGSYTATVAASVAATDGATLGTAFTWTFTVPSVAVPLTVASGTPAAGATAVARDAAVTAVFSRDITTSTLSTATFLLKDPSNNVIPATVAYNPASRTATLTASALLTASTTYSVQLTNAIQADDGTPLSGTTSWTFTTSACPCSVFAAALTPSLTGNPTSDGRTGTGPFTYELGMKFTVDTATQLTAIRFYKDAGETGSHTGTLWTIDGTKVTTVAFSNETSSGWQQQALSAPVQLQTGTTYIVSVNANASFGVTPGGLAASQGTGPLHSVVGSNGVFGSAAGVFPTGTYNSTNYFVDVVVR